MKIRKRGGHKANLDITKIQKQTFNATDGLENVSQSELELDAQIKFVDDMSSSDIQDALIKTAVDKIDIDRPNWTFVGARLFLYDLYHKVGKNTNRKKGEKYQPLADYIAYAQKIGKMIPSIQDGYDLDDLNAYIKPERDLQFNYLGIKTLHDRYLIKDNEGNVVELPQQMFMGIAMFLAQNEENKQAKAKEFYDVVSKFEVMLATPTLSNARTNRHQLSSCYIGSTPDNIEGIFDSYKEMSLLSKYGGGIGWDWTQIRSMGGEIDGNKKASGGTVPFLKITNDIAIAVDQLGTRKGAIAVYLEPWHMDIEDFLDLKKNSGEERRRAHDLFPALWINDLFMKAVMNDEDWFLFDPYDVPELAETYGDEFEKRYTSYVNSAKIKKRVIKAKQLWKKILTSYFESGSPFLCFKDTANRANPNPHVGHIRSSNLCTEIFQNTQPNKYDIKLYFSADEQDFITVEEDEYVETNHGIKVGNKITALDTITDTRYANVARQVYCVEKQKSDGLTAVCNLASINLSKINTREDIERVVPTAVRMLDNVIDLNFYPNLKVKNTNMLSRAIGLGVMGESEMLAVKNIHWGSHEHKMIVDEIMESVSFNTIQASMNLSKERGSYINYEGSNWSQGIFPIDCINDDNKALLERAFTYNWDSLRDEVKEHGMRNGYLMAVAPTSSISILVGTTQAIEPIFKKKWYEENLSGLIPVVVPKLSVDTYQYYASAYDIDQLELIKVSAIRQRWIDQGQSTNIFMSLAKASGKHLHEIYSLAWKLGLKSTYYLRSQSPESVSDVEDRSLECSGCQ